MQITPHELMKLLVENAKRETEALLFKMNNEVKPNRNLIKVEVVYEFYDCVKDISTYSYNMIVTDARCNAVNQVITQMQVRFLTNDISIEYNPVCMCYDGYKRTEADGKIRVFTVRNIRDHVIDRIEV